MSFNSSIGNILNLLGGSNINLEFLNLIINGTINIFSGDVTQNNNPNSGIINTPNNYFIIPIISNGITQKLLFEYCETKYPDDEKVKRLVNNFNPNKISETLPTSEHTAYSENKGEKIAFCLNKHNNSEKLIDINTLTFVAIHELSHVMTKSEGHKQEFWENFKFLLVNAKESNIYIPIDYKTNPEPYCGMKITDIRLSCTMSRMTTSMAVGSRLSKVTRQFIGSNPVRTTF